jgi:hypothetical protein
MKGNLFMSNENKKRNKASAGPILMRTAGILFAITAVTVWATSFLFAKYTTGGKGTDQSRVAEFSVEAAGSQNETIIDLSEGDTGTYIVTLTNKSETAVSASLVIDYSKIGKLISKIEAETGEGENAVKIECTPDAETFKVTTDAVALGPKGTAAATKTVTLTITFPAVDDEAADMNTILALTKPMNGLSGETGKLPFDIFAVFTQID